MMEILQYAFMQKAILTGSFIAIACSLLGSFLILKKFALIGDGLAHISFGGIAIGMLANVMPFVTALLFSVISALGIIRLKEKARVRGDTAIGIISHASLGIGIFLASIAHGFNVDILSYLFGNILAISGAEVFMSVVLAAIVILLVVLFYHELVYLTFDEQSARTSGVKVEFLDSVLITLTAITIVASMRVVGLLLAASLIIIPAAASLQVAKSFKALLTISMLISVVSVLGGLVLSYFFDWAASGTIVLLSSVFFIVMMSVGRAMKQAA
jgi:zinc transport system permease protein